MVFSYGRHPAKFRAWFLLLARRLSLRAGKAPSTPVDPVARRPAPCIMQHPSKPHPRTPGEPGPEPRTEAPTTGALVPLGSFLHQAILATDGTVSTLIESFRERVEIEKLSEETVTAPVPEWPELPAGTALVRRTVLVRGAESRGIFLHAESLLVLDRLDPGLRGELLSTAKPIGKLIREQRRESYRELLGNRAEVAGERAAVLGCGPAEPLIARTYRIHFGGQPAIQITERFRAEVPTGSPRSAPGGAIADDPPTERRA